LLVVDGYDQSLFCHSKVTDAIAQYEEMEARKANQKIAAQSHSGVASALLCPMTFGAALAHGGFDANKS
jgi:hypothetical protein